MNKRLLPFFMNESKRLLLFPICNKQKALDLQYIQMHYPLEAEAGLDADKRPEILHREPWTGHNKKGTQHRLFFETSGYSSFKYIVLH